MLFILLVITLELRFIMFIFFVLLFTINFYVVMSFSECCCTFLVFGVDQFVLIFLWCIKNYFIPKFVLVFFWCIKNSTSFPGSFLLNIQRLYYKNQLFSKRKKEILPLMYEKFCNWLKDKMPLSLIYLYPIEGNLKSVWIKMYKMRPCFQCLCVYMFRFAFDVCGVDTMNVLDGRSHAPLVLF